MNRYFPELVAPLAAALPERCVVDGEIVIVGAAGLDFEALLLRIHPAASRVKLLAAESPASFVVWDLLALGDEDLREMPLAERRERLEGRARRARGRPCTCPRHPRSRDGRGLVSSLRGRRAGRRDGQAPRRALSRGRAHDDQGQASAHRRLRGGRLPLAQERPGHDGRLAAARALRRRGHAPPRRRHVRLHRRRPQAARRPSWPRCASTRSRDIRGATGPRRRRTPAPRSSGCRAGPAGGIAARI